MNQRIICKTLALAVILLFLGLAVQPSVADEVTVNTRNESENSVRDKGLGFISCFVFYIYFFARETRFAWNIKFELIDYDTGEVMEETTRIFGYYLFKFVPRGNNYTINVITPKGNESLSFSNLGFFKYIPIGIFIDEY
jgi:hypothetical protein